MSKKGFTLVELLAVIAIIVILVIIALPNIIKLFNNSKENAFLIEVKNIYQNATEQYVKDSINDIKVRTYSRSKKVKCQNELKLDLRDELEYFIRISSEAKVIEYYVTDGVYGFKYAGNDLKKSDIKHIFRMDELGEDELFEIRCDGVIILANTPPEGADLLMRQYNPLNDEQFMRTKILKSKIEKITFTNSLEGHVKNNVDCFDAGSYGRGKILSWVEDKNSNGLYEITIGSEEKIFPNNCSSLFAHLTNLKEIEGLEYINTYNCTNMMYMFYLDNNLTKLDVSHFKTNNVTDMKEMFRGLKKVTSLDVSNFNTSNVINMNHMFADCRELKTLDLSSFDTSKVTSMYSMLSNLSKITTLDLSNFDTSKVTDMSYMFYSDYNLKNLQVSNFDTSNVEAMDLMFYDTGLENLKLNNFNTSKVTNMEMMFANNNYLKTLDISSFDTSKVRNFDSMFDYDSRITTIYASDKFVTTSSRTFKKMFYNNKKLKGGLGTIYDANKIDGVYAHIDGGPSNPGYFTRK